MRGGDLQRAYPANEHPECSGASTSGAKPTGSISSILALEYPHPQTGVYVVRAGSTITLECRASGNPQPVITWKKKVTPKTLSHDVSCILQKSELPTGQKFSSGNSILIHSVRSAHAGVFVCMADNGVGNQARANINLTVLRKT